MTYANDEDLFEIPPYPVDWPAEQRIACYWHALNFTSFPGRSEGWEAVWKNLQREQAKRRRAIGVQEEPKP